MIDLNALKKEWYSDRINLIFATMEQTERDNYKGSILIIILDEEYDL